MIFLKRQSSDTDVLFQLTTPVDLESGEKEYTVYTEDIPEIPAISPMNLTSTVEEEFVVRKKIIETLKDFIVEWHSSFTITRRYLPNFKFTLPPQLNKLSPLKIMENAKPDNMETEEIPEIEAALNGKDAAERKLNEAEQKLNGSNNRAVFVKIVKQDDEQSPLRSTCSNSQFQNKSNHSLLLIATCTAATSLLWAFQSPGLSTDSKSNILRGFILLNSSLFFASMALITILMRGLPILPWLIISVSSTIGIYMCAIIAKFPGELVPVLFIGCSIFLAAFLQCLAWKRKAFNYFHWIGFVVESM